MRADEALKKSDVIQYDDAVGSTASMEIGGSGILRWTQSKGVVAHDTAFSNRWQPIIPEPKCPACTLREENLGAADLHKDYEQILDSYLSSSAPARRTDHVDSVLYSFSLGDLHGIDSSAPQRS
jgi:hypothetical protein